MADQTRGRVPILAGAAEANVRETIAACEYYHSLGVRAVAIVSPFYYKLSPAARVRLLQRDRPTTRRSTSRCTTFRCSPRRSTCRRCSGWPKSARRSWRSRIRSGDLPHMIRMIAAVRPIRPDFSFLTGWDAALMPMLLIGCDGGTNATSGVVPEVTRKLYDLTMAGTHRRSPRAAIQAADAVRHDALLGRLPGRLPGRGRAARLQHGRRPPAAGPAQQNNWRRCATRCNACWPKRLRQRTGRRLPGQRRRARHRPTKSAGSCRACSPNSNVAESRNKLMVDGRQLTVHATSLTVNVNRQR